MENEIKPEILSSIVLLNVGGQPYIEYNVNGMRDSFALSWEQMNQLQEMWRGDLFNLRDQREKYAKLQAENDEKTEDVSEVAETVDDGSIAKENANERDSE